MPFGLLAPQLVLCALHKCRQIFPRCGVQQLRYSLAVLFSQLFVGGGTWEPEELRDGETKVAW